MTTSPTQSTEVLEEAKKLAEAALDESGVLPEGFDHPLDGIVEQVAEAIAPTLRKQGAEEAERERDKWAVIAGIGMEIARAAQALLATVHPADGRSDPATVSRESITALQAALRAAEPEKGTPLDNARKQGAEEERERLKLDPRKLRALRLELPASIFDDAIAPLLATLDPSGEQGD